MPTHEAQFAEYDDLTKAVADKIAHMTQAECDQWNLRNRKVTARGSICALTPDEGGDQERSIK